MSTATPTHRQPRGVDDGLPPQPSSEPSEDDDDRNPGDAFVLDPTNTAPLYDEPRFASILEQLVADDAPQVFAVIQEYGSRLDAWIAAWGMSFDDHAEVVSVEGDMRMSLRSPDAALLGFHEADEHIHARLVWFNPAAVTPTDSDRDLKANALNTSVGNQSPTCRCNASRSCTP